jgi:methylated-DNA-[protein]-cysteine S-methyltransferase
MTSYTITESPLGELLLTGEQTAGGLALTSVSMTGQRHAARPQASWRPDAGAFEEATRQLQEYFAGQRTTFRLTLAARGTPFQERIWLALDTLRCGTAITYGDLAAQLGVPPDRVVALGAAVGANPLLIVRPCHRVVGAGGAMRGYAGGVPRKQWLLAHEGVLLGVGT